jgi:pimeloyl-ACP methyl ester carboxylesterase
MTFWRPGNALPGPERPALVPHANEQLYLVRHEAARLPAKASVVLAGPMTLERSHGYLTWVRLARCLALNGFDVLRFDYRGVGESPGVFQAQTFDTWRDDLEAVVDLARARGRVLILGLRLGALLASQLLVDRRVDGLAAWDPPTNGRAMLLDMLRRKLVADYAEFPDAPRRTRDEYAKALEAGDEVEVEGYPWTKALWQSASRFAWRPADFAAGKHLSVFLDGRTIDPTAAAHTIAVKIPRPAFWLQSANLVAELDELFRVTMTRLDAWAAASPAAEERRA